MGVRDLTLTDYYRLVKIAKLVRLEPGESAAFVAAATTGLTGGVADRDALLRPLERTRDRLAREHGDEYADDLIARLRR